MSVVFASSTCDLNENVYKKVGIEIIEIPLIINNKKVNYKADNFNFLEYYANPNVQVDFDHYTKVIDKKLNEAVLTGQDIVFLTPNAKHDVSYKLIYSKFKDLAKTYTNQKFEIVNCNNIGLGYGLVAYMAGIINSKGASLTELVREINKLKYGIKTLIVPSKLDNLKTHLQIVGESIGIKPVLELVKGEFGVVGSVKGKKNIVQTLINNLKTLTESDIPVAISYGESGEEVNLIEKEFSKQFKDVLILKHELNPINQNYLGSKTILISYYKKPKI